MDSFPSPVSDSLVNRNCMLVAILRLLEFRELAKQYPQITLASRFQVMVSVHAGDLDCSAAYLARAIGQAVASEQHPVRAERIRLDDVGARLDVFEVDEAHQVRVVQVDLLQALGGGHPFLVEKGTHGAVAEEDALLDSLQERMAEPRLARRHRLEISAS